MRLNIDTSGIRMLREVLREWTFPKRCPVCGRIPTPAGYRICADCIPKLSFVQEPFCFKCGKTVYDEREEYCRDCRNLKKSFEYGFCLLNYDDLAAEIMSDIKYKNKREYLEAFADLLAFRYEKKIEKMCADALVPVPIHRSRMRSRGFNQSELLARHLGKKMHIKVESDVLQRRKRTRAQKELDSKERLKNLSEAFICESLPKDLNNLIIIDDIYTTGSTIEACTAALKTAGAKNVYYLAVCIGRSIL